MHPIYPQNENNETRYITSIITGEAIVFSSAYFSLPTFGFIPAIIALLLSSVTLVAIFYARRKEDFSEKIIYAMAITTMKDYAAIGMAFLMAASMLIAAFVAEPFKKEGMQAFENPNDVMNVVQIFVIMLVFTAIILIIAKYKENAMKYLILFIFFMTAISIFNAFLYYIPYSFFLSLAISLIMLILLIKHPEWYVIDAFGIFLAGGIAAIFAISLSTWLIILLLILLAAYDAISVYKTRHMISLAKSVTSSNLPLLMIFPKSRKFSYMEKQDIESDEKDAIFMGLGDAIIPAILVAHAYIQSMTAFLLTFFGTMLGYAILMNLIKKGPQPGLPYLNAGAIAGYAIYLIYPHFLQ